MFRLSTLSLSKRLGVLVGSAMVGLFLLLAILLISEKSLILQERQDGVRQSVEAAHGIIAHFHAQAAQGKIPEAEAKSLALETIRSLRYSGTEYFWVNDMTPTMVMHAVKPELEGKDLRENKDPTGKHLFVEFVDTVKKSGAGFVPYMWPKPGSKEAVQKVSYVKGFLPWGWIIGSGVYVDTVTATVWERTLEMGLSALVLGALLLGIGAMLARSILSQVGGEPSYASEVARSIAEGDLGREITLKPGDTGSLLYGIKSMRDSVANIVGRVRQGSEAVALASKEIAQGNHDLSARTESQASALQQTAASMEELGSTVRQNADSAVQANQLAQSASKVALQGGNEVAQVVDTMKGINDASKQISEIIAVIDGISFQTNILALNAAVEAARAGEQGRGFAVVASEVRSLAGRSAAAAKEIKLLITNNVSRVETGAHLVDKARNTMEEVVQSIRRVSDVVAEISAASTQQSGAVAQVGDAITQMDQSTQQNAAMVEEMAAAASGLDGQAGDLVSTVAFFRNAKASQGG